MVTLNEQLEDSTRATMHSFDSFINKIVTSFMCFYLAIQFGLLHVKPLWSIGSFFLFFAAIFLFLSEKKTQEKEPADVIV